MIMQAVESRHSAEEDSGINPHRPGHRQLKQKTRVSRIVLGYDLEIAAWHVLKRTGSDASDGSQLNSGRGKIAPSLCVAHRVATLGTYLPLATQAGAADSSVT